MRTLLVLVCSLALAFGASGAQEKKKEQKPAPKRPAQTAQGAPQRGGPKQGTSKGGRQRQQTNVSQRTPQGQGRAAGKGKAKGPQQANAPAGQPTGAGSQKTRQKKGAQPTTTAGQAAGGAAAGKAKQGQTNVAQAKSKPIKPRHINVPKQPNTAKAPPVKFQQNRRIKGSQNWQGQKYAAFRNYKSEWHDKNWWHSHHNRIVFVFGAPYFWNAGYWYPAWGYYPNAYYAWDGPIYAYNNLPPDQVIANVQSALQQQGYYQGDVDGLIGPLTRDAIAAYQRDHGLYVTSAIDQPTLQSLGMT
ncbi:MAG TPA: peptidoglycan-binding protein [Candidatus Udaeobacter sp.]|nr:peptidoglycan-binding protein [Candidatus Udaeobacter sp.]